LALSDRLLFFFPWTTSFQVTSSLPVQGAEKRSLTIFGLLSIQEPVKVSTNKSYSKRPVLLRTGLRTGSWRALHYSASFRNTDKGRRWKGVKPCLPHISMSAHWCQIGGWFCWCKAIIAKLIFLSSKNNKFQQYSPGFRQISTIFPIFYCVFQKSGGSGVFENALYAFSNTPSHFIEKLHHSLSCFAWRVRIFSLYIN
jgi:hypothetical protein